MSHRLNPRQDASWSFETAQFFVGFYAEPEEADPADHFEFLEDIEAVREGRVEWFSASVRVFLKGETPDEEWSWQEVGSDHLGGCAYNTVREFYTSHRDVDPMNRNCTQMRAVRGENTVICHYFPSMVHMAVSSARAHLARLRSVRLRVA